MNDPAHPGRPDATFLDRARSLLEGRLAPADADALRREIDADPSLREEIERLRDVLALTAAEPEIPAPSLAAEDVLAAAGTRTGRAFRWRVAAAVLVAAAAIGVAANLMLAARDVDRDVDLAALCATIPVQEPAPPYAPQREPFPARLADFRPVENGRPNWVRSYDDATALARESGKPMLVWIEHPECPMCVRLDRETFTDAGVQADLEAFVPVRVDVMKLEQDSDLGRRLEKSQAWPFMAAIDADGTTLAEMAGVWTLDEARPAFDRAAKAAEGGARPTWEQVRTAAAELVKAEEAHRANRLGDALTAARRAAGALPVATEGREPAAIRVRAYTFGRTLPLDAQRALETAAAADDPQSALGPLDAAARAFAGSPEGDDLAAVALAIRETGRFPRLHDRTETHR